ncbi:MAG TPA: uracil-DNA glycosylase [Xanthobacteraceae bacterium]|nr:uracil-DNA glycosylase [Xanthobacteraceae bacterium]
MKTPRTFAAALAEICLPSVFNPYRETCVFHDRPDAATLRRRNLERWLEAALDVRVDTLWIARDLGYRGGRRTGVPLTDEVHLGPAGTLMGGIELERATHGPAMAERTAAVVWQVLTRVRRPVVLWNVFPLHPHNAHDPFSNRCHTRVEREATWPLMTALIDMIRPKQIVAIGRDAGIAMSRIDIPIHVVRHPSYGGQAEFATSLCALYGIVRDRETDERNILPLSGVQAESGAAT